MELWRRIVVHKNHQFLVNLLLNGMPVRKDTKIKDIRQFFKQQSGIIVAYSTAHKAKEAILNEPVEAQREQFSLNKN
jgi:hypothetical protein